MALFYVCRSADGVHDLLDAINEQQHVAQETSDALLQHVVRHVDM